MVNAWAQERRIKYDTIGNYAKHGGFAEQNNENVEDNSYPSARIKSFILLENVYVLLKTVIIVRIFIKKKTKTSIMVIYICNNF